MIDGSDPNNAGAADGANDRAVERALREELQAAERRAAFLAEASSIMAAASLHVESAIRSLARLAVSRLADWCVVYSVEPNGRIRHAEVGHRDPRQELLLRPLRGVAVEHAATTRIAEIIDSGQVRVLDTLPPELVQALADTGGSATLHAGGPGSVLIAPLLGRGRALGALLLVSARNRYTTDDTGLVEELARRAAIAIDNARLFHEAQQANRAKSDFLAVMSHELRTPLNAIMGYTDLLDAEIDGPLHPRQRRQLSRIRASARQLLQLIEEVLGFARLEAGTEEVHLQRLPIGSVVTDAVTVIEPFARSKELAFEVEVEDEGVRVETDAGKVRQILVNVLSNAVKFTAEGSVRLRVRTAGDTATFEVCDTGSGIEADQLDRIFDPFWQVERPNTRRVGGTGLGLSVSQRYARLLGGEIRVASEPGRGSCFTLVLPLRFDAEVADTARAAGVADTEAEMRFAVTRSREAGAARASDDEAAHR